MVPCVETRDMQAWKPELTSWKPHDTGGKLLTTKLTSELYTLAVAHTHTHICACTHTQVKVFKDRVVA